MEAVSSTPFLPRVKLVPRSVMTFSVARALQGIYAEMLQDTLPNGFAAIIGELEKGAELQN